MTRGFHGLTTSPSLLQRLRASPDDPSAWDDFVRRYHPLLEAWGRHWGLQEADAQDVAQTVLVRLTVKLRQFVYDPAQSFRGWLRTMTRRAWLDFVAERQRGPRRVDDPVRILEEVPAGEDLEQRLSELFDLEVLQEAADRVRRRVADKTWEAFRHTALLGRPAKDAAEELGMPVGNVFKARSNVQKMLQEEVRRLEGEPV